jgi:hypothetical protein
MMADPTLNQIQAALVAAMARAIQNPDDKELSKVVAATARARDAAQRKLAEYESRAAERAEADAARDSEEHAKALASHAALRRDLEQHVETVLNAAPAIRGILSTKSERPFSALAPTFSRLGLGGPDCSDANALKDACPKSLRALAIPLGELGKLLHTLKPGGGVK